MSIRISRNILPAFAKLSSTTTTKITCCRSTMSSTQSSREGSCETDSRGPSSPLSGNSRSASPSQSGMDRIAEALKSRVLASPKESDSECWERMLALQKEYHCYQSARLEAAVDALESGWLIEDVPMPSRLCLDLLNDGLKDRIRDYEAIQEGLLR
ncbi:hypothetical protein CJF31_00003976 [Rutstroemia sp. NJR-2017a BVV2]|nr:hypothetical protein CJF31_00003976 [Rutstroemia sp. NJR-2017a BVV2]